MNPELQKSLQVTPPTNTLDSYMLMILLIMVVAGILGGVANYYLSDRQGEPVRRDWAKYLILGVISALTVPLFLNMLSRNLLEAARTRPVKREMAQIKQAAPALREEPFELPAVVSEPEVVRESLSYNDIEILRELAQESYVYGNLVGLTDKTGLARDLVSSRLAVLKSLGVIETRMNERNVLHWFVSPKGKQMLGDVLSGQEEH